MASTDTFSESIVVSSYGVALIASERERQVTGEGYTPEHDDEHQVGELALAAALYATPTLLYEQRRYAVAVTFQDPWPWEPRFDGRPHNGNVLKANTALPREARIRQLVKAGALIAAEIDRLERLEVAEKKKRESP